MPQSRDVRTLEIEEHADHAADAAAASRGMEQHLSPHEETVQSQEHGHAPQHEAQVDLRLHHGKEAAEIAARAAAKATSEHKK